MRDKFVHGGTDNNRKGDTTISKGKPDSRFMIDIVRDLEQLELHAAAWNELALHALQQLPMLSHAWVASYFEHRLVEKESWLCIFAYEGDDLVGVVPIVVQPHRLLGTRWPQLKTPRDLHTSSVDFLVASGRESDVVPVFLKAIDEALPGWYCLTLDRLPETSPSIEMLEEGVFGTQVIKKFDGLGTFLDTTGSFDDYRAGLSSKFKRNLKNANNRVARLPEVKVLFLSGTEATEDQLDSFLELEASGWKGKSGTAILGSPELRGFYRRLVQRFAQLGGLEWHFLESEGTPMVGQLAVKLGKTLVALKIGYDDNYARYSPGNYLYERLIERAFDSDDTDEINFLSDMGWLRRWGLNSRTYYNVYVYPRRFMPLMLGMWPKKLRILLRKLPGLLTIVNGLRRLFKRTG